jgi:uncharacterized membrane protein
MAAIATLLDGPFLGMGIPELMIFLIIVIMVLVVVTIVRYAKSKSVSPADELIKYKKLLDDGAITQEEFDRKKLTLL